MRIGRFLLGWMVAMLLLPLSGSLRAEEFPLAEKLAQLSIKAQLVLAYNAPPEEEGKERAQRKKKAMKRMRATLPKIDAELEEKLKSVFTYENYELLASPLLSVMTDRGAKIRLVENLTLRIHPTIMRDGKTVVMELGLIEMKQPRPQQAMMRRRAGRDEGEERKRRLPREETKEMEVGEPVATPVLATTLRMKDGSTVLLGGTKYHFGVLILAITATIE